MLIIFLLVERVGEDANIYVITFVKEMMQARFEPGTYLIQRYFLKGDAICGEMCFISDFLAFRSAILRSSLLCIHVNSDVAGVMSLE